MATVSEPTAKLFRERELLWYGVALVYGALVVYGSLYTAFPWRVPSEGIFNFLFAPPPRYVTRADITTNILAYFPLGFSLAQALGKRFRNPWVIVAVTLVGTALSVSMETLQTFMVDRDASRLDVLTNGTGMLIGAVISWMIGRETMVGKGLRNWRSTCFRPGVTANLGVALVVLGIFTQPYPFVPSIYISPFLANAALSRETVLPWLAVNPLLIIVYTLDFFAVWILSVHLIRPGRGIMWFLLGSSMVAMLVKLATAHLLLKQNIFLSQFTLEAAIGWLAGMTLLMVTLNFLQGAQFLLFMLAIGGAFALAQFSTSAEGVLRLYHGLMNGMFYSRLLNLGGLGYLLSYAWPVAAILYGMVYIPGGAGRGKEIRDS
jgi:VanZ family protein